MSLVFNHLLWKPHIKLVFNPTKISCRAGYFYAFVVNNLTHLYAKIVDEQIHFRLSYLPVDAGSVTACTMSVDSASRTLVRNSVFFAPGQPGK